MIVYLGSSEIIKNPDIVHSKKLGTINVISQINEIDLRKAFDIYYSSKLAEQISNDSYGIENMDAKYLAEDLIENEPELFK